MKSWRSAGIRQLGAFLILGSLVAPPSQAQEPQSTNPGDPPPAAPRATPEELLARAGKPAAADDPMVIAIVAAHNQLRAAEKLPPLTFAPLLALAAQVQAADMA